MRWKFIVNILKLTESGTKRACGGKLHVKLRMKTPLMGVEKKDITEFWVLLGDETPRSRHVSRERCFLLFHFFTVNTVCMYYSIEKDSSHTSLTNSSQVSSL
jgi:hypothetical protein